MHIFDDSYHMGIPRDYFNKNCEGIVYIAPRAVKSHIIGVHDRTLVRITLDHEIPPLHSIRSGQLFLSKVNEPIESSHDNVVGALEKFFQFGMQFEEDVIALPFSHDLTVTATDILRTGYIAHAELLARQN